MYCFTIQPTRPCLSTKLHVTEFLFSLSLSHTIIPDVQCMTNQSVANQCVEDYRRIEALANEMKLPDFSCPLAITIDSYQKSIKTCISIIY